MNRVALVGYTNAGKSTLMRALTGSEVYVADKLFATLDTTVRPLVPETDRACWSRTRSASSTSCRTAWWPRSRARSTRRWRRGSCSRWSTPPIRASSGSSGDERGAGGDRRRRRPAAAAFNKIDRVGDAAAEARVAGELRARWPEAIVLSARRPADVAALRERLVAFFARELVEGDVHVPYDRQQLRGEIFASCEVLAESYDDAGVIFRVRAHPAMLERLRAAA